ncbi:Serine peptidase inhibitor Kunitz type 3 [Paragonimus heterotremus]|uniref:Serine peptidase inhibitor Kunitz type 3 n=1 Tax=Paragonimus heterotremus TaxID=100268 RepID=A0A8J4SYK0_9TREM|nr:Serine peptidase inhibitor Kunitz type 3 [Paragonimus heterotremus]
MGSSRSTVIVLVVLVCVLFVEQSGALQQRCLLPPERGPCRRHSISYAYDPQSGQCVKFVYGGCRGNGNRFDSKEECEDQCARGLYDFA